MLKKVRNRNLVPPGNRSGALNTNYNISSNTPSPELAQAKSDLENHTPIDPSIAAINAPDSNWRPDNNPDPESKGLFRDPDTGRSGVMTPDNFWDANNDNSVRARMLWNTRRLTHDQAFKYAAMYKQPIIIDRNKQIEDAWNKLPIYTQDSIRTAGFPDDTYGVQRFLWQKAYDEATLLAIKEVAAGKKPTQQELDSTNWSPIDDTGTIRVPQKYDPRSNPHRKEYDPHYDINNPAYDHSLDPLLKPMTVVQLLSATKRPYDVVLGHVYWDTGRFSKSQAELYLKNGYIEPYKPPPCVVQPWNESLSDLPRFVFDYIACTDTFKSIEDLVGEIGRDLFYLAIGVLLVGGYLIYNNRQTIKSVGRTAGSYALEGAKVGSNLIPGKAYITAKQKEAAARGISLKEALGEDVGRVYNPIGIVQNVAQYQ